MKKRILSYLLSLLFLLSPGVVLTSCSATEPERTPATENASPDTEAVGNRSETATESATVTEPVTETESATETDVRDNKSPVDLGAVLGRKDLRYDYNKAVEGEKFAESPVKHTGTIDYLDMVGLGMSILPRDSVTAFDTQLAMVTLQGLANRDGPAIFLRNRMGDDGTKEQWVDGIEADLYWLNIYLSDGQYLSEANINVIPWSTNKELDAVEKLFQNHLDAVNGIVVWDPDVPATMLAAMTVAGVEGLIPVRYSAKPRTMYSLLTKDLGLEVKVDLREMFTGEKGSTIPGTTLSSSGSAKNDVYLWAKANYLDKGLTSDSYMCLTYDGKPSNGNGYTAPHAVTLAGFDFLVSEKAFFFSLSGTNRGTPQDDRKQPAKTDYNTFNQILLSQYQRTNGGFTHVVGWPSVSDGTSDATLTEWLTVELLGTYNASIEMMDVGFSTPGNVSLFRHIPEVEYKQTAVKKDVEQVDDRIYLMFYMGDYDSVGWLTNVIPQIWESEGRGKLPLAWGISPVQGERAVHVYNYMYQTATENDYFVSVNNGAAYLNPAMLLKENKNPMAASVSDGLDAWTQLSAEGFQKYGLSAMPFYIATSNYQGMHEGSTLMKVLKSFTQFSPDGFGVFHFGASKTKMVGETPLVTINNDGANASTYQEIYNNIYSYLSSKPTLIQNRRMLLFREVIVDPMLLYRVVEGIHNDHPEIDFEVVDPYTFFEIAAERIG